MQTSPTTILRRLMILPLDPVTSVVHLGIDDFALRRGRIYGTVLVDLQRHKVIDLLPDRKAETAKIWMQAHSEIRVVSRDRAGDYATAAHLGASQAIEAADRFHLVKFLAEAVEKALVPCRAELQKGMKAKKAVKSEILEVPSLSLMTVDGQPYSAHQAERYDRYQQAIALRKQGMIVKEIAKRVGLGRRTIQRWVSEETYVDQLVQAFLQMIRQLGGEHLESWLRSVRACNIPKLHRFANGLERNKAAVLVGLTLFHNNGQVEGRTSDEDQAHQENDVWACGVCIAASARLTPR